MRSSRLAVPLPNDADAVCATQPMAKTPRNKNKQTPFMAMSTPRQTYEQNCRFFAAETRQNPGGPCLSTAWNCVLLNCLKATPLFDINPFVTRGDGPRTQVQERGWRVKLRPFRHRPGAPSISDRLFLAPEPLRMSGSEPSSVGTWLSLVEHSLGVRGVGSSNLPVPTN